jgi:hypothetical protein
MTTYSAGNTVPQTSTTINGQQTCRIVTPMKGLAMLKMNGSVPLPKGFIVSGIYQDQAGPAIDAVYAVPNADIAPSLGRNLAGGANTMNIPLVVQNSLFEGRVRRLDLRLTKHFQLGSRFRLQANLDAYNALNSSAIQSVNNTFGASWLRPTQVLDPRILQFSGQLTF